MKLTNEEEDAMQAAQKGYEAYRLYTENKSLFTGDSLPEWKDLPVNIKNAWFASTKAIRGHIA